MSMQNFKLKGDLEAIVLWQKVKDGVGEPALVIRTWNGDIIEIKQEEREIFINRESLKEIIAVLKKYLKNSI